MSGNEDLAGDLLEGAYEIAEFWFGNKYEPKEARRKVYYFANAVAGPRPPIFRVGSTICARRSTLKRWIAEQEQAAASEPGIQSGPADQVA